MHYTEMHIIYTDQNKILFFHIGTVLCNALFTSFDKLLCLSRKKEFLLFVKGINAPSPAPRCRCELFVLAMFPSACQTHDSWMEHGLDCKGDDLSSQISVSEWW
jgi:hypothetical protein